MARASRVLLETKMPIEWDRCDRIEFVIAFLKTQTKFTMGYYGEAQLPNDTISTITITREKLAQFRDNYARLLAFAARVCGVRMEDFTDQTMIDFLTDERNFKK